MLTRRLALFRGLDAYAQTVVSPVVSPLPAASAPERSEPAAARVFQTLLPTAVRPTAPEEVQDRQLPIPTTSAAAVRYRVASGDTLLAIALRYRSSVEAIVAANNLPSAHVLRIGQELTIPSGSAATRSAAARTAPAARRAVAPARRGPTTTYEVGDGDTLFAIARRYGTTVNAIVAANDLPSAHRLRVGQRLTLPVGGGSPRQAAPASRAGTVQPSVRANLSWPARGTITSRYGWRFRRHHDGIDIASARGTPIYAARSGRVRFAGWYYGYGRAVIIDHGGGLTTLYGHASALLVRTGEVVERGDLIARVGCTGRCTGSHLHFEVRINGRAVNPLPYLR
jgi:murein DD-endopeptidase MepM/ murein hydrolase activator NlpD